MNLYLQNLRLNNSDIVLTLLLLHLWFTISIRTVLYAIAFLEEKNVFSHVSNDYTNKSFQLLSQQEFQNSYFDICKYNNIIKK